MRATLIRRSRQVNRRALTVKRASANLAQKLGRPPTDAELASLLARPIANIRKYRGHR